MTSIIYTTKKQWWENIGLYIKYVKLLYIFFVI